ASSATRWGFSFSGSRPPHPASLPGSCCVPPAASTARFRLNKRAPARGPATICRFRARTGCGYWDMRRTPPHATPRTRPSKRHDCPRTHPFPFLPRHRRTVDAVVWLLGMFYLFPWLEWDGRQAVLFDLPARKFYVFGLAFWPQDFLFLALLLIIAAFALFFFTALAGRLWCGYACPQTVWTEVFLWMERWTEGDRPKRMKLDAGPWNREKILRKGAKHALWLAFAL